jgi:hypothetical protein
VTPRAPRLYGTITALDESPLVRGFLAAGTDDGNVWISRNDGGTWTDLTARFRRLVPDTSYVSRVEFSPHDANRFYVTFSNHRRATSRRTSSSRTMAAARSAPSRRACRRTGRTSCT